MKIYVVETDFSHHTIRSSSFAGAYRYASKILKAEHESCKEEGVESSKYPDIVSIFEGDEED